MAFGLRQQGIFSLSVAGFAPSRAQNRQQKVGLYHAVQGPKTPTS
jgi:hypothetical protein